MLRIALAAVLMAVSAGADAETIEEKAAVCGTCHGPKGLPKDKSIPIIWGQNEGYLYLQFRDFLSGARKNDRMMTQISQSFTKEDALAFAEYFSSKPWPNDGAPEASKADTAVAVTLNKAVVCTSCHLSKFQGDSAIARLAGQQRDYLLKAMLDFRSRTRANNPGMSDLMNTATPEQLAAMAAYLAGF
jgi:cytochrome c553